MLKAVIVFCLIGVQPCTTENAVYVLDKGGRFQFCPMALAAHIREASKISKERGNGEYFKVLCLPAE